ncbi:MAG TPA: NADH-quinone oxidoreductase subunit I [Acidobacteriota bacterium]
MKQAFLYLWEILKGSLITARHFWVNLTLHTLRLFRLTKRQGAVTIQYPEVKREISPRHRSLHRLMKREGSDKPRCVACLLCATVCPSECILIEAAEDPDPDIQKVPYRFIIDLSRCCFCGFCVEACPEDALRMDSGRIDLAERDRGSLVYEMDRLLK